MTLAIIFLFVPFTVEIIVSIPKSCSFISKGDNSMRKKIYIKNLNGLGHSKNIQNIGVIIIKRIQNFSLFSSILISVYVSGLCARSLTSGFQASSYLFQTSPFFTAQLPTCRSTIGRVPKGDSSSFPMSLLPKPPFSIWV